MFLTFCYVKRLKCDGKWKKKKLFVFLKKNVDDAVFGKKKHNFDAFFGRGCVASHVASDPRSYTFLLWQCIFFVWRIILVIKNKQWTKFRGTMKFIKIWNQSLHSYTLCLMDRLSYSFIDFVFDMLVLCPLYIFTLISILRHYTV